MSAARSPAVAVRASLSRRNIRKVGGCARERMRLLCDAYRLADRGGLVLWWQDRCWWGIDGAADGGDPAWSGSADGGASTAIGAAFDWVREHQRQLAGRLEHPRRRARRSSSAIAAGSASLRKGGRYSTLRGSADPDHQGFMRLHVRLLDGGGFGVRLGARRRGCGRGGRCRN